MNTKKKSPITEGVNRRFFQAIDLLIVTGKIRGLETFCHQYGLSRPKYAELRRSFGPEVNTENKSRYTYVEYDAIYHLSVSYSFSANWLLLGKGKMLTK